MTGDVLPVALRAHGIPQDDDLTAEDTTPPTGDAAAAAAAAAAGAASVRAPVKEPGKTKGKKEAGPRALLVFDTETLVDETQALTFGCWRYYERTSNVRRWVCLEEGLLYADDLPETDPDGYAILQAYARSQPAQVERGLRTDLLLLSRSQFVAQKLFGGGWQAKVRIVGFNLPFDLSRLAIAWSEGRGPRKKKGEQTRSRTTNLNGFSLTLAAGNLAKGYTENRNKPRLQIKHLSAHRSQISFSSAKAQPLKWRGDFVDLRTLSHALTGAGHSLESACAAFGVPGKLDPGEHGTITPQYVDYCRRDVAATGELYIAAERELIGLGLPITVPKAISAASLSKATLRGLGVHPVLKRHPDTDPELLGLAMGAFYGGRAECRIRRTEVPVSLLDFTSTYPTLFALTGLWRYVIADDITTVRGPDAIETVRQLVDSFDLNAGFDPSLWPQTVGYALLEPVGDVLPVRAQYDPHKPGWNIGVNQLTSPDGQTFWYAIADVLASKLLTGRTPEIVDAVLLRPDEIVDGLTSLTLPGGRVIDPRTEDPWTVMTEERQKIKADPTLDAETKERLQRFLKITSNSGGYGIWAEYNQRDLPKNEKRPVTVHTGDGDPFTVNVHAPEDPGSFCYPPLAACVTAGARLLLALLERCVTDAGGVWAFADTDSMAIVATPAGGLMSCDGGPHEVDGQPAVRALSAAQVEAIQDRFTALNPYDQAAVPGSVLKHELDAYAYVIAAKRYALYRYDADGLPRLAPADEHDPCSHGLGHLINPVDPDHDPTGAAWVVQLWEHELAKILVPDTAGPAPAWYGRPTLSQIKATSPRILGPFRLANRGRDYARSVKPFNFLSFAPGATMPGGKAAMLVAPRTRASRWASVRWWDVNAPLRHYRLSTDRLRPGMAHTLSHAASAASYVGHCETKSNAPDGGPCESWTTGLLRRRQVIAGAVTYLGKEANRLDERKAGWLSVNDLDEVQLRYAPGIGGRI